MADGPCGVSDTIRVWGAIHPGNTKSKEDYDHWWLQATSRIKRRLCLNVATNMFSRIVITLVTLVGLSAIGVIASEAVGHNENGNVQFLNQCVGKGFCCMSQTTFRNWKIITWFRSPWWYCHYKFMQTHQRLWGSLVRTKHKLVQLLAFSSCYCHGSPLELPLHICDE